MTIRPRRHTRDDRGVSSIELVLYMPLLLVLMFIGVQSALVWYGNQAASAVARETARSARVYENAAQARAAGLQYAATIADGSLEDVRIDVVRVGDNYRVTVTGRAQELIPIGVPTVRQTVEGPVEEFEDAAP